MTEKHERDHCKHTVHAKLKLIEEVDILQDDTAGKPATVSYNLWFQNLLSFLAYELKRGFRRGLSWQYIIRVLHVDL